MNKHFEQHLQKFIEHEDLSSVLPQTLEQINLPQFTISDIGITHRWITHWHDKGLLLEDKPKGRWRTFNISEFIWLRMIVKLRAIGVDFDNIRILRTALGSDINWPELFGETAVKEVARKIVESEGILNVPDSAIDQALSESKDHPLFQIRNWLELLTLDLLITKEPLALIVTWKGSVFPHRWNYPLPSFDEDSTFKGFMDHSFISISMNDLVAEFIGRQTQVAHEQLPDLFSESEWRLLLEIREGNAKEIKITSKNGAVTFLEISQDVMFNTSVRLSEILMKKGYQELEVKTVKGEVVTARITDKIKYQ
jgi:DNA-binding transcriptional MerR regulator